MKMRFEEKIIAVVMVLILALSLLPIAGFSSREDAPVPLAAPEEAADAWEPQEDMTASIEFAEAADGQSEGDFPELLAIDPWDGEEFEILTDDLAEAELRADWADQEEFDFDEELPAPEQEPEPVTEPVSEQPARPKVVNKMEIDPELQLSIDENTLMEYANYLYTELGFNTAAISGILANMQQESGFDINKVGDMGFAYGLCQWRGARLEKLTEYCRENGLNPVTREGQLAYFKYEMQEVYIYAYDLIRLVDNSEAGVERATYDFCAYYEVPSDPDEVVPARMKLALQLIYPTLAELGMPVGN